MSYNPRIRNKRNNVIQVTGSVISVTGAISTVGNISTSGTVTGSVGLFTSLTASIISASQYLGPIGGGSGDVSAAGTNNFSGINTFNNNYITASIGITGSDAKFTVLSGSTITGSIATINNITTNVISSSKYTGGTVEDVRLVGVKTSISKVTSDITLGGDHYAILADASTGDVTVTLPPAADCLGQNYKIKKMDSTQNAVNILRNPSTITVVADSFIEKQVLSGSFATQTNDRFGYSVALNAVGNIALVGAYNDETGSVGQQDGIGIGYIYVKNGNTWIQQAILTGSLAINDYDSFGWSVALNDAGNIAIVGALYDETVSNTHFGTAYIFVSGSNGWYEEAILTGSLAQQTYDWFGNSVALNGAGNIAFVGANYDQGTGSNYSGVVYVFASGSTGWTEQVYLTGSLTKQEYEEFGNAVALNTAGNIALIGAWFDETGSTGIYGTPDAMGLAYIFSSGSTGWKEETILTGSLSTGSNNYFGVSVALNSIGDIALIGSYYSETGSNPNWNTGFAYIFRSSSNGWKEEAILSSSAPQAGDFFGYSVALNAAGNIALVGAYQDETGSNLGLNMGLAYLFVSGTNGWIEKTILSGSLATGSADSFGWSVALNASGNIALVGAYQDETGSNGTPDAMGLAYVFQANISEDIIDGQISASIYTKYEAVNLISDGSGSWNIF